VRTGTRTIPSQRRPSSPSLLLYGEPTADGFYPRATGVPSPPQELERRRRRPRFLGERDDHPPVPLRRRRCGPPRGPVGRPSLGAGQDQERGRPGRRDDGHRGESVSRHNSRGDDGIRAPGGHQQRARPSRHRPPFRQARRLGGRHEGGAARQGESFDQRGAAAGAAAAGRLAEPGRDLGDGVD